MPLDLHRTAGRRAFPYDLASRPVEAKYFQGLRRLVFYRSDVAIESYFERRFSGRRHGAGEKNPITPDHRTGVGEAGNSGLPADILPRLDLPLDRRGSRTD